MTAPDLHIGHTRYETGEGKVIVQVGPLVRHFDPPTARAIAIALIHDAEVAGLPPPEPEGDAKAAA